MTRLQKEEHKIGNQLRRERILYLMHHAAKPDRGHWARRIGAIQKGKYT